MESRSPGHLALIDPGFPSIEGQCPVRPEWGIRFMMWRIGGVKNRKDGSGRRESKKHLKNHGIIANIQRAATKLEENENE
jgi:hypothetical protein